MDMGLILSLIEKILIKRQIPSSRLFISLIPLDKVEAPTHITVIFQILILTRPSPNHLILAKLGSNMCAMKLAKTLHKIEKYHCKE